jgi:prevent-host-death family protein
MKTKSLPATEVKNRFGRVLREISQTGGPIIVERDGKPVAVILSVGEYERIQPRADLSPNKLELLESTFGLWTDRADIDDNWLVDGRSQWKSSWTDD